MPSFLTANLRWLAAGFLLLFCGCFGQTFVVALSGGAIRREFGLSDGAFGALYAGVTLAAAIPGDLAVAMDPQDLDEVAGNLIDNAARHAHAAVHVQAQAEDRQIRLTVTDDGPGIAETDRIRATEAGTRLDERGDGHGFGLAIARELAELHGGRLILDEAKGGGLCATVLLPRATPIDRRA